MLVAGARRRLNHRHRIRSRKGFLQAAFERVVKFLVLPLAILALLAATMFAVSVHIGVLGFGALGFGVLDFGVLALIADSNCSPR
jgi:hypothetical protein